MDINTKRIPYFTSGTSHLTSRFKIFRNISPLEACSSTSPSMMEWQGPRHSSSTYLSTSPSQTPHSSPISSKPPLKRSPCLRFSVSMLASLRLTSPARSSSRTGSSMPMLSVGSLSMPNRYLTKCPTEIPLLGIT